MGNPENSITDFLERKKNFIRRIKEPLKDEEETRFGYFGRNMMERSDLLRYCGHKKITRITIEYNDDTGVGEMIAVSGDHPDKSIRANQ